MVQQFLQFVKADGWEAGVFDDTLICPCGYEIELDGECEEGCVSPIRTAGII